MTHEDVDKLTAQIVAISKLLERQHHLFESRDLLAASASKCFLSIQLDRDSFQSHLVQVDNVLAEQMLDLQQKRDNEELHTLMVQHATQVSKFIPPQHGKQD